MKRNTSMDLLRVIACFSVVMLHAAAQNWYTTPLESTEWFIINTYDSLFHFGVPLFVMMSGALFLSSQYALNYKHLYFHSIFRILIIYILWSIIYGLYNCYRIGFTNLTCHQIGKYLIAGKYHLWYLPFIIGMYMLVPILKTWISNADDKNIRYFLMMFFVMQIILPTLYNFTSDNTLPNYLNQFTPPMVSGYVGYFILGYYIFTKGISPKIAKLLYISLPFCILTNVIVSTLLSRKFGFGNTEFSNSFGAFTFLINITLFHFFINVLRDYKYNKFWQKIISGLAADTFGIYIIHLGIMESNIKFIVTLKQMPAIYGVPLLAIVVFVLSLIPTMLIRRIPKVGRYVV